MRLYAFKSGVIKAMAFNASLDSYIDAVKKLKKTLEDKKSVDEVELYPSLSKS